MFFRKFYIRSALKFSRAFFIFGFAGVFAEFGVLNIFHNEHSFVTLTYFLEFQDAKKFLYKVAEN